MCTSYNFYIIVSFSFYTSSIPQQRGSPHSSLEGSLKASTYSSASNILYCSYFVAQTKQQNLLIEVIRDLKALFRLGSADIWNRSGCWCRTVDQPRKYRVGLCLDNKAQTTSSVANQIAQSYCNCFPLLE
jgi:hypothetical protein